MLLPLLIVLVALVPGCGVGGDGPVPASPAPTSGSTGSAGAVPILTDADRGKTITLKVGREALLRLRPPVNWDQPSVSGNSVAVSQVDYLQDPGFIEFTLRGVRPGTVVVSSTGLRQDGGKAVRFEATIRVVK